MSQRSISPELNSGCFYINTKKKKKKGGVTDSKVKHFLVWVSLRRDVLLSFSCSHSQVSLIRKFPEAKLRYFGLMLMTWGQDSQRRVIMCNLSLLATSL